jgi:hypothetical protein
VEITLTDAMGINDRCTIVANGNNKKSRLACFTGLRAIEGGKAIAAQRPRTRK